jgi:hypothetical protein
MYIMRHVHYHPAELNQTKKDLRAAGAAKLRQRGGGLHGQD